MNRTFSFLFPCHLLHFSILRLSLGTSRSQIPNNLRCWDYPFFLTLFFILFLYTRTTLTIIWKLTIVRIVWIVSGCNQTTETMPTAETIIWKSGLNMLLKSAQRGWLLAVSREAVPEFCTPKPKGFLAVFCTFLVTWDLLMYCVVNRRYFANFSH